MGRRYICSLISCSWQIERCGNGNGELDEKWPNSCDAADGRVGCRRHDRPMAEKGRRRGRARRAAVRDLDRQGRCRDSIAQRGRPERNQGHAKAKRCPSTPWWAWWTKLQAGKRAVEAGRSGQGRYGRQAQRARLRAPPLLPRASPPHPPPRRLRRPLRRASPPHRAHLRTPVAPRAPVAPIAPVAPDAPSAPRPWSAAEARELRLSPVVRKIARAHHVDVRNIAGSGAGGRVTKNDILAYLDAGAPAFAPPQTGGASAGAGPCAAVALLRI